MNYRKATVLASEDVSIAGVKTIDIKLQDIISRLQIKFNATNTDIVPTAHHATQITKVELVDGSEVLWSMSGKQIEAKMFYDYKNGPSYEREFRNDIENYLTLDVLFGRKLYDPQLALDPTKFKNPQLKITHNKALGGSLPDAATMEIYADVFDEKPAVPVGWIMSKEFYTFTSPATAANKYIDLPRDYPIKRIMLQTIKADSWFENLVTSVTVNEDNDKRKPIDHNGGDLLSMIMTRYGECHELIVDTIRGTGPQSMYIMPSDSAYVFLSSIGLGASGFLETNAERTGGYQTIEANATHTFRAMAAGFLPHGCLPLDFGDPEDLEDWYDVTKKGSVQLIPKVSGEVAFNVILEQLRKY